MRGVNKVIILGNLGDDPTTRYMPSGGAVTNISIATSETWKDKQSGQKVEKTEWHKIIFFNKLAEIAGQYLKKGSKVYIEGKLQTKKWQDKDGSDRWSTEIVANEMQMLGSRGDQDQSGAGHAPAQQQSAPQAQGNANQAQAAPAGYEDFNDDIPF